MIGAVSKWQTTVIVLAIVIGLTLLAAIGKIGGEVVATGLLSFGTLVLGAGANAHGVSQGSKASADPPAEG